MPRSTCHPVANRWQLARTRLLRGLLLVAIGPFILSAEPSARDRVYAAARSFELRELPARPDWAGDPRDALLRFAWFSDCHLTSGDRYARFALACRTIREQVKPHFVVITGDNCAMQAPASGSAAALSPAARRQEAFRRALETELALPYAVIPGDNWPWDFEQVFGPFQYSFDAAGLHLVFLAPDAAAVGVEGCSIMAPETWAWLRDDLAQHAAKPTLVFLHEPLLPPTTLEAESLRSLLEQSPGVLAVMAGHAHLDLEFRENGLAHLICPSLGLTPGYGFKVLDVHAERIVINTWEYADEPQTYVATQKWQKLDIPEPLRASLKPVPQTPFQRENPNEIPAHPRRKDQSLAQRRGELFAPMFSFLMRLGLRSMFQTHTADEPAVGE